MARNSYNRSVFINCPDDERYKPLFRAAVFAVMKCGYDPRAAQEEMDSSEVRLEKIFRIMAECRYGIHDLSRIELDRGYPRFNMPLELGIFLGAKRYGCAEQHAKVCLIFEKERHTYERFISDINGLDIVEHQNKPELLVKAIRNWLANQSKKKSLPSGKALWDEYLQFTQWLPTKCESEGLGVEDLNDFDSYWNLVAKWKEQAKTRR